MSPDQSQPDTGGRIDTVMSRRRLLQAAGVGVGVVVLGGAGFGTFKWTSSSSPKGPTFLSRPDLIPPTITTLVPAAGTAQGLIFLSPSQGPSQYGPMIVDNKGEVVWFHPLKPSVGVATNVQVNQYQGQPVMSWWEGPIIIPGGYGKGEYVMIDSSYTEIMRVQAGNGLSGDLHEFQITPEGTALLTAYETVSADLSSIGGSKNGTLLNSHFQEIDIASGSVLFDWDARQHISLSESYLPASSAVANNGLYDFFHINSVQRDVDGNYIISGRHTWTVYKIARATGEVMWRLNGKLSDFAMGQHSQFAFQHDARLHGSSTMTVFDDGGGPPNVSSHSRGLELSLDFKNMSARLVREFLPSPEFLATSQGSVQVLPNGNVFVGWGAEPYWSEYSRDGRMLFNAQFEPGGVSYRAYRFEWVGKPADVPAIRAKRKDRGTVDLYVSWNGSTEVQTWNLLAGSSPSGLVKAATSDRDGFETKFTLSTNQSHFAASALDGNGNLLATSPVVKA